MGSEERQELEAKIDDLEERVDEYEKTQKDIFLTICQVCLSTFFTDLNQSRFTNLLHAFLYQRFIAVLSDHLTHCDQEGVDYETTWFLCTLDNCRQLLVQVCVCVSVAYGMESHGKQKA